MKQKADFARRKYISIESRNCKQKEKTFNILGLLLNFKIKLSIRQKLDLLPKLFQS